MSRVVTALEAQGYVRRAADPANRRAVRLTVTPAGLDYLTAFRSRRDAFLARTLPRQAAAGQIDTVALIDGSVLANAPFRPAVDALRNRPARRARSRRAGDDLHHQELSPR